MERLRCLLRGIVQFAVTRPWLSLFVFLVAFFSSVWHLQYLSFDSSAQSFLRENDPERLAYLDFEEKYGLSAYFIVLVRDHHLFTNDGVERLRHLHQQLEHEVPYLQSIESIINARYVNGVDDDIFIDTFLENGQFSDEELIQKYQLAQNIPYYQKRLLNDKGDAAAIIIALTQYDENNQRLNNLMEHMGKAQVVIESILQQHQGQYEQELLLGGSPLIGLELTKLTRQELLLFSLIAFVVVGLLLLLLFKQLSAVTISLALLAATNVMVLASMSGLGHAVQLSSIILPSFLMAVGVADSVHFLRAFFPVYYETGNKKKAIVQAAEHTAVAMFFTSLTTAVGLLSFANSTVASIANFGVFAAIGVWIALLLTLYCLPAALVLLPIKRKAVTAYDKNNKHRLKLARYYAAFLYEKRKPIVYSTILLLLLSLLLASQLRFSMDTLAWFKPDHSVRMVNHEMEHEMGGVVQLELLVSRSNRQEITIQDLHRLDSWLQHAEKESINGNQIQSAVSLINLLKETHRVLLPEEGYVLPSTQELLAQELLLLQFDPESIESLVDDNFTELRVTLSFAWMDALESNRLTDQMALDFVEFLGDDLQVVFTGMLALTNKGFKSQIKSMISSYVVAGLVIWLLLILMVKNVRLGTAIMLVPNTTPIAFILALMYLLDIPLDVFTLLIGSIAIGIIVDDTIHLLQTYQSFLSEKMQPIEAMAQAFVTTGKALSFTTVILCLAFLTYCLSSLVNLVDFGYLTALCIALALVGDLLVLPALLFCMSIREKEGKVNV